MCKLLNIQKSTFPQISQKTLYSKKTLGNAQRADSTWGVIPLKRFSVSAHCKQEVIIRDATILAGSLISTRKHPEVAEGKE